MNWYKIAKNKNEELITVINSLPKVNEGDYVNGLKVRKDIPNLSSISASLGSDYRDFGVREVPMEWFSQTKESPELASEINVNKEINPLIVVVDGHKNGLAYILEGSHRMDALNTLEIKTFPALVLLDEKDIV